MNGEASESPVGQPLTIKSRPLSLPATCKALKLVRWEMEGDKQLIYYQADGKDHWADPGALLYDIEEYRPSAWPGDAADVVREWMANSPYRRPIFAFSFLTASNEGIVDVKGKVNIHAAALHIIKHLKLAKLKFGEGGASEIFYYDAGVYVQGGEEMVEARAEALLEHKATNHIVNEIKAKVLRMLPEEATDDDNKDGYVCLQNGVLNIYDRSDFQPHSPEWKFTIMLPLEYVPGAVPRCIDEQLERIFMPRATVSAGPIEATTAKDEDERRTLMERRRETFYEIAGNLLEPGYGRQKAFVFYGPASSGKSTASDILVNFVGMENCAARSMDSFDGERFATSTLYGKMANIAGELDAKALKGTAMLKRLTGGDVIPGEMKNKPEFRFRNRAKLIFACNQVPQTPDRSSGFYRRWVLLPFLNVVSETEREDYSTHMARLTSPEEMSGLLNRALDGIERLQRNGRFTESKSDEATEDLYEQLSDSVGQFLNACCEIRPPEACNEGGKNTMTVYWTDGDDVYREYVRYCRDKLLPPMIRKHFNQAVVRVSAGGVTYYKERRANKKVFGNLVCAGVTEGCKVI